MIQTVLSSSAASVDIYFEVQHNLMSVHTRIGAGYSNASKRDASNGTRGFFLPKIQGYDPAVEECSFWTVLARSLGVALELIAIPGCSRFEQDTTFYLRAIMVMPEGHDVINIEFYGDDGNSSLSHNLDEDSEIKEGRQSIGFLVKCDDPISQEERTELWLLRYDDILFQKSQFKTNAKNEVTIHDTAVDETQCIHLTLSDEDVRDVSSAHVPRSEFMMSYILSYSCDTRLSISCTFIHRLCDIIPPGRLISTERISQNPRQAQLNLCGSRGTGGVLTFGGPTCLQIFDLEEDEDTTSSAI
jgi:hypothetical protein